MDVEAGRYQRPCLYWPSVQHDPTAYHASYPSFLEPQYAQHMAQPSEPLPLFAAPDTRIRNGSKKRRACNECKQQKLRCDLSQLADPAAHSCSRCKRLGLDCRIDRSFRRERKRKRSEELEKEVDTLKQELSRRAKPVQSLRGERNVDLATTCRSPAAGSDAGSSRSIASFHRPTEVLAAYMPNRTPPGSTYGSEIPARISAPCQADSEHSGGDVYPGQLTDREYRAIEHVQISMAAADHLFREYFRHYHRFLAILDARTSPEQYFSSSPLLFWAVISVASRRYASDFTLLSRLAGPVTSLVWQSLQSIPRSIYVVQALALLCTWPFPISSSTADVSYLWAGSMMQICIQAGLHRPLHLQDFSKRPVRLSAAVVGNTARTWAACNIVAQSVSVAHGLVAPVQYDWALASGSHSGFPASRPEPELELQLRLALFTDQIARSMSSNMSDPVGLLPTNERMSLYRVFSQELDVMEASVQDDSDLDRAYILGARLHLQSFFLFDEPDSDSYTERIITLFYTATALLQHTLDTNRHNSATVSCSSLSSVQSFVAASFIALRVLKNDYFKSFLDADAGQQLLQASVNAISAMSVASNDIPSRYAAVLSCLWIDAPSDLIAGHGKEGLQLRIRSRSSMSVLYDSLWLWRKHFRPEPELMIDTENAEGDEGASHNIWSASDQLTDVPGVVESTGKLDPTSGHQHLAQSFVTSGFPSFNTTDSLDFGMIG